jgi:hypothetical protein
MGQVCKLCLVGTDIQKSHAIADSVFKKIFRANSGKAITFSRDEENISYSSDSWWDHQLCSSCETLLNINYEKYSLQVIRAQKGIFNKTEHGLTFSGVNLHIFNMFFLSIFWRAANSGHKAYKNVVMLDKDNEFLREALFHNRPVPISRFSVKIERLIDRTTQGGFTMESLKELIVSPFCRIHETHKINNVSVCFIFEGFFIQIYMPGLKLKNRTTAGVINKSKIILSTPYLDLFSIKEIEALMVEGYSKHINGQSRVKS